MRKIKYILAREEILKGEYQALINCGQGSTVSHWKKISLVMDKVVVNHKKEDPITPEHLRRIGYGADEEDWQHWVDRCEKRGLSIQALRQELREHKWAQTRKYFKAKTPAGDQSVTCGDFRRVADDIPDSSISLIFTDPPYDRKHLAEYSALGKTANRILTPGGQSPQIWDRKINTFWKPILLFGAREEWIGDVVKSDINDNDKRFHAWGQSESGMARLVKALTKPGDLICDPFLGAGTTGVVAISLGRQFVGADIDKDKVDIARKRIGAAYASK